MVKFDQIRCVSFSVTRKLLANIYILAVVFRHRCLFVLFRSRYRGGWFVSKYRKFLTNECFGVILVVMNGRNVPEKGMEGGESEN